MPNETNSNISNEKYDMNYNKPSNMVEKSKKVRVDPTEYINSNIENYLFARIIWKDHKKSFLKKFSLTIDEYNSSTYGFKASEIARDMYSRKYYGRKLKQNDNWEEPDIFSGSFNFLKFLLRRKKLASRFHKATSEIYSLPRKASSNVFFKILSVAVPAIPLIMINPVMILSVLALITSVSLAAYALYGAYSQYVEEKNSKVNEYKFNLENEAELIKDLEAKKNNHIEKKIQDLINYMGENQSVYFDRSHYFNDKEIIEDLDYIRGKIEEIEEVSKISKKFMTYLLDDNKKDYDKKKKLMKNLKLANEMKITEPVNKVIQQELREKIHNIREFIDSAIKTPQKSISLVSNASNIPFSSATRDEPNNPEEQNLNQSI